MLIDLLFEMEAAFSRQVYITENDKWLIGRVLEISPGRCRRFKKKYLVLDVQLLDYDQESILIIRVVFDHDNGAYVSHMGDFRGQVIINRYRAVQGSYLKCAVISFGGSDKR